MKRVYLAGAISDTDRKRGQVITGNLLMEMGYDVYAPALNDSINDKSNNPTPLDIYNGDIDRIKECDIFVVRLTCAGEDGTLSEIGMVSGWNEQVMELNKMVFNYNEVCFIENQRISYKPIKIVAYTTNERALAPQFWNGIASEKINHLVAGMIDKWGIFVGSEEDMLKYMEGEMNE